MLLNTTENGKGQHCPLPSESTLSIIDFFVSTKNISVSTLKFDCGWSCICQTVLDYDKWENEAKIRNTYLQFNCNLNLAWKFVSFDWMVHQTQSNKNRICSDNWSSCNACISMVKAQTLFEYQLEIAQFNIACRHVMVCGLIS